MKRILLSISAASLIFASCQDAPKADDATVTDAQQVQTAAGADYKADLAQSKIEWIGTKPVGKHHGTLMVKEGTVTVADNAIKGGSFVIDIKSLKPDDQDSTGNAKLQGHLLSPDFFDADKFPNATFTITEVKAGVDPSLAKDLVMKDATHTITGNLTLKDVTKSVSFPAKVSVTDASVTADANFNIDRTQWNMAYGSDKSLGDKFIDPRVNLALHLVANK